MEIAVLGEDPVDAVFPAHRDNLRIEDEVAAGVGRTEALGEEPRVPPARVEDAQGRAGKEPLKGPQRFLQGGGRIEEARVCDDPDELADCEDRQGSRDGGFREMADPPARPFVQGHPPPVGVDQDVGVDGDQDRSSVRS